MVGCDAWSKGSFQDTSSLEHSFMVKNYVWLGAVGGVGGPCGPSPLVLWFGDLGIGDWRQGLSIVF